MKFASKNRRFRRKKKYCHANASRAAVDVQCMESTTTVNTGNNSNETNVNSAPATPQVAVNIPVNRTLCTNKNNNNISKPKFRKLENRSLTKISANKVFEKKFENSPSKGRLTRSITKKLGLSSSKREPFAPSMYSLIDLNELNTALINSAICSACRNPRSRLVVSTSTSTKFGLAEKIQITCNLCNQKHFLNRVRFF